MIGQGKSFIFGVNHPSVAASCAERIDNIRGRLIASGSRLAGLGVFQRVKSLFSDHTNGRLAIAAHARNASSTAGAQSESASHTRRRAMIELGGAA